MAHIPTQGEGASARQLPIQFTASGSEYFRIWIVNILLTIVTLGLYHPFAKARRIRYFYANTLIDGQALAFHGDPWRMFRGFILLAVLGITYSLGGKLSPAVGLVAFCVIAAIWPALWRSSLIFRLGNTSWRGLRFRFQGGLKDAYLSFLPLAMPLFGSVLAGVLIREDEKHVDWRVLTLSGLSSLAISLLFPWCQALLKRYQHGGYCYASQRTQMNAGPSGFYGVFLKAGGLALLSMIVAGIVAAVGAAALRSASWVAFVPIGVGYFLVVVFIGSYATARLQDLVWDATYSQALNFKSSLGARALAKLTFKNWLLTLVTLSLYRPFAVIHTTQLRLAAIALTVTDDIDTWQADPMAAPLDAAGDAAGDFFGFDVGF